MLLLEIHWATISAFATAAGTLVLAVATFSAVRSSNRSARIAEAALQEQRRPLLTPSRFEDPKQKIMFLEGNWVSALGGRAAVVHDDGIVYLAVSLRNVGSGMAVCQGWSVRPNTASSHDFPTHAPLEVFRFQTRDLYVPPGDIGMWQGALRDPDDLGRAAVADAIDSGQPITLELLYSDLVGRQRTISRFGLVPAFDTWIASLTRHWYLDWEGPRPEELTRAAAEMIFREREAVDRRRAGADDEEPASRFVESVSAPGTDSDAAFDAEGGAYGSQPADPTGAAEYL
jgi:hypothetical protein